MTMWKYCGAAAGALAIGMMAAPVLAQRDADAVAKVRAAFNRVDGAASYKGSLWTFSLRDADSGEELIGVRSDKSFQPASVNKVVTTAAALEHLGTDYRFRTTLVAAGAREGGTLNGDIIIRGGGDPTLGSDRAAGGLKPETLLKRWTDAVRAAGIESVTGCVRGDETYYPYDPIPRTFEWSDMGNYYGAGPVGLNYRDNLYHLLFVPAAEPGKPVEIRGTEPPLEGIVWRNRVTTGAPGSGDRAYIFAAPGSTTYWVRGTIPPGGNEFRIRGTLMDPALQAARELEAALRAAGVAVGGSAESTVAEDAPTTAAAGEAVLDTLESPELADIVRVIHKQSFNVYAETLLLELARRDGAATRERGAEAVRGTLKWLGVDDIGFRVADGSGLSRANLVTASGLTALFRFALARPWGVVYRETLPAMGTSGDLSGRGSAAPLAGRVQAKTGLIGGVRSLAGYVQGTSGRQLTFALIVNHSRRAGREADADIDGILRVIVENF